MSSQSLHRLSLSAEAEPGKISPDEEERRMDMLALVRRLTARAQRLQRSRHRLRPAAHRAALALALLTAAHQRTP
jgi:hypothetical protein